jgi:hypothetical protein
MPGVYECFHLISAPYSLFLLFLLRKWEGVLQFHMGYLKLVVGDVDSNRNAVFSVVRNISNLTFFQLCKVKNQN